jgi:hypothetical protein
MLELYVQKLYPTQFSAELVYWPKRLVQTIDKFTTNMVTDITFSYIHIFLLICGPGLYCMDYMTSHAQSIPP